MKKLQIFIFDNFDETLVKIKKIWKYAFEGGRGFPTEAREFIKTLVQKINGNQQFLKSQWKIEF